jgi:hypothetical protein
MGAFLISLHQTSEFACREPGRMRPGLHNPRKLQLEVESGGAEGERERLSARLDGGARQERINGSQETPSMFST